MVECDHYRRADVLARDEACIVVDAGARQAKAVADLSPGSGILASACLELGIPYFGMCQNAMHMQWLSNVIDRYSLRLTVTSGSFLYREDLAMHISELFARLLPADEAEEDADCQIQRSDDEREGDGAD